MTALSLALLLSFAAVDEEGCQKQGDIFHCEAQRSFEVKERVQSAEGCVERDWIVTEVTTTKRAWGDDDPFVEDTRTTRKIKRSRVIARRCG